MSSPAQHDPPDTSKSSVRLPKRRIAFVDIGSRSIKASFCVFVEGQLQSFDGYESTPNLAAGTTPENPQISDAAIKRALVPLTEIRDKIKALGITEVYALATAAVRHDPNRDIFLKQAEKALGFKINVISGETEAMLISYGFLACDPHANGLGTSIGGATMAMDGVGKTQPHPTELLLGSLTLKEYRRLGRDISKIIRKEFDKVAAWLREEPMHHFHVTSDLFRVVGRLALARRGKLKLSDPFPYGEHVSMVEMQKGIDSVALYSAADMDRLVGDEHDRVKRKKPEDSAERLLRLGKILERKPSVVDGALILHMAFTLANPSAIIFWKTAMRAGLMYALNSYELDSNTLRSEPVDVEQLSSPQYLEPARHASRQGRSYQTTRTSNLVVLQH